MSIATEPTTDAGPAPAAASVQLVVFNLGPDEYGIPIGMVQEIIRHTPPRPIPGSAHGVQGLINLRGSVIPVIDLRARLGAGGPPPDESSVVIVELPDATLGLQVDEVREVLGVSPGSMDAPPAGLGADGAVSSVARLDDRLLVVLDLVGLLGADGMG
jgi:purine-binding chemotaxis protein CheW